MTFSPWSVPKISKNKIGRISRRWLRNKTGLGHRLFSRTATYTANIMIRDGRIAAIIDWEFSGWYPPYWEYGASWYGHPVRRGWEDVIPKILDPPEGLEMEINRQRFWGKF